MEQVKSTVRKPVRQLADWLDRSTKQKITPSQVTLVGLIMHLPIAWLIVDQQLVWAGLLLIVFGLFDTLDGELARLQKRTSLFGAFLDSSTDRIKEILLYSSLVYLFSLNSQPQLALLAVAVLGVSFIISYLNAAGDVATHQLGKAASVANKTYRNGLAGFEVRMALLVVGLLLNLLVPALVVIGLLGIQTIWLRFAKIRDRLSDV